MTLVGQPDIKARGIMAGMSSSDKCGAAAAS